MLQGLAHRTKNDLATSYLSSACRRSETAPAAQPTIASAVARVDVIAKVQDRLRDTSDGSRIALGPYLESLCGSLADYHRGVRPVDLRIRCEDIQMRSPQAASIGLVVNELVTNCFKYAFPDHRPGVVEIDVCAAEDRILITVSDEGVGCPAEVKSGLGTRIINLLATQMKGTMDKKAPAAGLRSPGVAYD
ncbi:hypothetical protein XH90_09360 [Bradyrhizobium sp. CCBAU 53338]|nr:hypothetical protein XH90_09360 [Bradyrhizobium sp. CCBAU 53338]